MSICPVDIEIYWTFMVHIILKNKENNKMDTIKVYDINELKKQFPDTFEKVLIEWRTSQDEIFWQGEIVDSLKKCFETAGLSLEDWLLGGQGSYVEFTMPTYWSELSDYDMRVEEYTGRRALNWLKDAFGLKSVKRVNYIGHDKKKHFRYDVTNLDGSDWSCEFTGYCADHDYLESLLDDVCKGGCTLEDAFSNLADVCGKLIEQEIEYQQSEEYFLEEAEANDYQYTEDGVRV